MRPTHDTISDITAVILAAGAGRRMGGEDKGLMLFKGRPLITHVLERLAPQCDKVLLNINRNREAYADFGYPMIEDTLPGGLGPLAGLLSAMEQSDSEFVLSVPCDTPQLPNDLVLRLFRSLQQSAADVCTVDDGERLHPVIMLAKRSLRNDLRSFLEAGGRKVRDWFYLNRHCTADFSEQPDAFININTPQQLRAGENVKSVMTIDFPRPILGFVAYSGTGKTTLLEQLIPRLRGHGVRVALLKHAHHNFDIDIPGKDSYRLRKAGATQIMVASRQRWALITEHDDAQTEPNLEELLPNLDTQQFDLLLVEGFKHEAYPKIELQRHCLGKPDLYPNDPNIIALAVDEPPTNPSIPILDINQPESITEFILKWLAQQRT